MAGLQSVVTPERIRQALAKAGRVNERSCRLTHEVRLWVVVAWGLFTNVPIRQVFQESRRGREGEPTPGRSSLCEARQRLGVEPVKPLHADTFSYRHRATAGHTRHAGRVRQGTAENGDRRHGVSKTAGSGCPRQRGPCRRVPAGFGRTRRGRFPAGPQGQSGRARHARRSGPHQRWRSGRRANVGASVVGSHSARRAAHPRTAGASVTKTGKPWILGESSSSCAGRATSSWNRSSVCTWWGRRCDGSCLAKVYPSSRHRQQDRPGFLVRRIESTLDEPQRTGHGERHRLLTIPHAAQSKTFLTRWSW